MWHYHDKRTVFRLWNYAFWITERLEQCCLDSDYRHSKELLWIYHISKYRYSIFIIAKVVNIRSDIRFWLGLRYLYFPLNIFIGTLVSYARMFVVVRCHHLKFVQALLKQPEFAFIYGKRFSFYRKEIIWICVVKFYIHYSRSKKFLYFSIYLWK